MDSKDDRQPYTDSYSFTVSQRLPWSSLLEVAYVGNRSQDLQNTRGEPAATSTWFPLGAMLGEANPATANANNYRPIQGYRDLNLATNNLYANYNALQVTWVARRPIHHPAELHLPKGFGHRQPEQDAVQPAHDPFNLRNNYGVQPGNRTHLFNAAYSIVLGNPIHNNKFVGGVVNGWQLSGITQIARAVRTLPYNSGANDELQHAAERRHPSGHIRAL